MPPTTLVEFHTSALAHYGSLVSGGQTDLATAQAALVAADAAKAAAVSQIAALLDQRAAVQSKLATITLSADAAPLLAQLEQILIDLRAQQAALLAQTTAGVEAAARVARAEAQLRRATAGVAAETAALAEATARSADEAAWKDVLASPEFTTAVTQASDAFTESPPATPNHALAKERVEGAIPNALLTAARARATAVLADAQAKRDAAGAAITAVNTALTTHGGLAGASAKAASDFEQNRDALRDAATQTLARIDRALRLLAGVVASPQITSEQAAGVTARLADVDTAQGALDDAIEAAITAAGLDPSDPASADDPAVANAPAVVDARAALKDARDKAEAAVPEAIWRNLDAFDEAERLLTSISTTNFAQIAADFGAAEQALAEALDAERSDALQRALRAEELIVLKAAAERAASPELIFSALRGDG